MLSPCIVPVWSDSQILVWMIGEVCIEMLAGVSGVNISTARRGGEGGEGGSGLGQLGGAGLLASN